MAFKEYRLKDIMRGGREDVVIRFDGKYLVELPCYCKYDPALCGKNGNQVMLIKKIEIKDSNDSWRPYPSVTWLDGIEYEDQLITRAFIKKTNGEGFDIMSSTDGVPDAELMDAAKKAGIHTETLT